MNLSLEMGKLRLREVKQGLSNSGGFSQSRLNDLRSFSCLS